MSLRLWSSFHHFRSSSLLQSVEQLGEASEEVVKCEGAVGRKVEGGRTSVTVTRAKCGVVRIPTSMCFRMNRAVKFVICQAINLHIFGYFFFPSWHRQNRFCSSCYTIFHRSKAHQHASIMPRLQLEWLPCHLQHQDRQPSLTRLC